MERSARAEAELWATWRAFDGDDCPPGALDGFADLADALEPPVALEGRPLHRDPDGRPWALHAVVARPFERWHLVGILNWRQTAGLRAVLLADLGLEDDAEWVVHDFWGRASLGTATHGVGRRMPARSALLLALRRRCDWPQVSGTTRHVTVGGVELCDVHWDPERLRLEGVAAAAPFDLLLRVPHPFVPLAAEGGAPGALAEARMAISLPPADGPRAWSITFRRAPDDGRKPLLFATER